MHTIRPEIHVWCEFGQKEINGLKVRVKTLNRLYFLYKHMLKTYFEELVVYQKSSDFEPIVYTIFTIIGKQWIIINWLEEGGLTKIAVI